MFNNKTQQNLLLIRNELFPSKRFQDHPNWNQEYILSLLNNENSFLEK